MTVRTRFAPSPTGYLHIGGARTALFNWLHARQAGGQFLLRIEDTDKNRSTDEATDAILEGLRWLGMDWDEELVFQGVRTEVYRGFAEQLLDSGRAYRCYCPPRSEDKCACKGAEQKQGVAAAVRFEVPRAGTSVVRDILLGDVEVDFEQIEDFLILRSDGSPLYNFCVVVDDSEMRVTHVLRGNDHLNNTHKQILIYDALGHELPTFGHMPLIHNTKGGKLSKRDGEVNLIAYRDMGYTQEAMLNFLARMGWGEAEERLYSREELLERFELTGIKNSPAKYDLDRLRDLGKQWMQRLPAEDICPRTAEFAKDDENVRTFFTDPSPALTAMVPALQDRAATFAEVIEQCRWAIDDDVTYQDHKSIRKNMKPENAELFEALADHFDKHADFTEAGIRSALEALAEARGVKFGKVITPARAAVTGAPATPPGTHVIAVLGKDRTVARLRAAAERVRSE